METELEGCLIASTASGALAGSILGGLMAVPTAGTSLPLLYGAGAAFGLGVGLLSCPYLAPNIKTKIEQGLTLNEAEALHAANAMSVHSRTHDPKQSVKLLAAVRSSFQQQKVYGQYSSANNLSRPSNFGNHLDHPHHQSRAIAAAISSGGGGHAKKG